MADKGANAMALRCYDLFDMHCHLGFCVDAAEAARELAALGVGMFSNTVTPAEFAELQAAFAGVANVRVGVGLHPWWAGKRGALGADVPMLDELARQDAVETSLVAVGDLELLCELTAQHRFIGEVGLDFSPRHVDTRAAQLEAFEAVASACARAGDKVLSMHAVHAVDDVLDVLERASVLGAMVGNACIIHWFSGTSDQLTRARRAGCYFSVNPRMLQSKRGRAYAQSIPADRLLLETDKPASVGAPWSAARVRKLLEETLAQLAALRGDDPAELRERIAQTSRTLLQQ